MPVVADGRVVLALVRGDDRLNEMKLLAVLGEDFRAAEDEEIRGAFGAEGGFAAGFGGAGATFGAGGGQVTLPSLITVSPRMASSSMLTLMTPSFVLHSSSASRKRLVPYSVEDCFASRLGRSV